MNARIDELFLRLRREGRTGLGTYLVAGDPDPDTSLQAFRALVAGGADLLEVGIPFSDPVADGPVVAAAHVRALRSGQTLRRTLELVGALRREHAGIPVVLMGYANPLLQYGPESFFADARRSGVDGLIVVDLPLEHAAPWADLARAAGIDLVRMLAPTTPEERAGQILSEAEGFAYLVTRTGITGSVAADPAAVQARVAQLRHGSDLPLAAGFGISSAGDIAALGGCVDLAVVGSCLVDALSHGLPSLEERLRQLRG